MFFQFRLLFSPHLRTFHRWFETETETHRWVAWRRLPDGGTEPLTLGCAGRHPWQPSLPARAAVSSVQVSPEHGTAH